MRSVCTQLQKHFHQLRDFWPHPGHYIAKHVSVYVQNEAETLLSDRVARHMWPLGQSIEGEVKAECDQ